MSARVQPGILVSPNEPSRALGVRCLECGRKLGAVDRTAALPTGAALFCAVCSTRMGNEQGIWMTISAQRQRYFAQFIREYQQVRAAEGRGSDRDAYYLGLPFHDLSGCNRQQWSIRAKTFKYLERYIFPGMETIKAQLDVLDLGAGNGWLSYRLALRGHRPVAVDLLTNAADGLGAASRYFQYLSNPFPRFQAELSRLPFTNTQFDCAIFNASFHYAENYEEALGEAIRCLRRGGWVVIADSPWYRKEESGQQMLRERAPAFVARYGFASDSIKSQEYLTDTRIERLAARFGLEWEIHRPFYGWRWSLRPLVARITRKREPSEFRIYVARVN